MKWRTCIMTAVVLSGCTYAPDALRQAMFKGSAFQDQLARRYRDYATLEEERYNWNNAIHFADKGLFLAYGNDVDPESLEDWNIPADALPELQDARAKLMAVLTQKNMDENPSDSAQAQFNFDCWVDEQEKAWKTDDIADCRAGFDDAMKRLSPGGAPHKAKKHKSKSAHAEHKDSKAAPADDKADKMDAMFAPPPEEKPAAKAQAPKVEAIRSEPKAEPVAPAETKAAAAAEAAPTPAPAESQAIVETKPRSADEPESRAYVVLFKHNSSSPVDLGNKMITEAADSLKGKKYYDVVISKRIGSTMEPEIFNQRVQAVKKTLTDAGVDGKRIRAAADSAAAQPNGAKYSVEIFLGE